MRDALKKFHTTMGFYQPAFLRLHVHVDGDLADPFTADEYSQNIFFHEYVHFIQDLTTVYGLMNSCVVVDYMRYANRHIIDNSLESFNTPLEPIDNAPDNVAINYQLRYYYEGSGSSEEATFTNFRIDHTEEDLPIGKRNIPEVVINYTDGGGYCLSPLLTGQKSLSPLEEFGY